MPAVVQSLGVLLEEDFQPGDSAPAALQMKIFHSSVARVRVEVFAALQTQTSDSVTVNHQRVKTLKVKFKGRQSTLRSIWQRLHSRQAALASYALIN